MTPARQSLTALAQQQVRQVLRPGDWAVDATAGNGHDTAFLADCVGPSGQVFAFDRQQAALEATRQRLQERGLRAELIRGNHADLLRLLPEDACGRLGAVMFNLGYLPGGDKAIVTRSDSTCTALDAALTQLRPGGIVTLVAYRGHPGGAEEALAVENHLRMLATNPDYDVRCGAPASGSGPVLHSVRRHC